MPHPVEFPLGVVVFSLPMHLFPYALISLRTCLPMHSTFHDGKEEWQEKIIRKDDKRLILRT